MNCCGNSMTMGQVACPKPRRAAGPSNFVNHMPFRFHVRNDDPIDSKTSAELLDLMFRKGDCGLGQCENASSSPPFFFGSPPHRALNPMAQDSHFGVDSPNSICSSPADSARSRVTYVNKQAAVRVEGFDCERSRVVME